MKDSKHDFSSVESREFFSSTSYLNLGLQRCELQILLKTTAPEKKGHYKNAWWCRAKLFQKESKTILNLQKKKQKNKLFTLLIKKSENYMLYDVLCEIFK